MNEADSIVAAVRLKLLHRSRVGILKYGTTLDREDLSLVQWLAHAQEEALDLANYLERLLQDLQGGPVCIGCKEWSQDLEGCRAAKLRSTGKGDVRPDWCPNNGGGVK